MARPLTQTPAQAQGQQWMSRPARDPGCPPGLEYLTQVDQVLVHQMVEVFELLTGMEMCNKYVIKNSLGQQIYYAYEESDMCHRIMCKEMRGFTLHVMDNSQQEVMRIVRPFQCCAGCCWCADSDSCGFVIQVEAPPGNIIGYTRQSKYVWKPNLDVQNKHHDCVLKIRGPCRLCQTIFCTDDVDFMVKTPDLQHDVGKISKQWAGLMTECFTKADMFSITFPVDLDVNVKATLMGAMILIEFMLYEKSKN